MIVHIGDLQTFARGIVQVHLLSYSYTVVLHLRSQSMHRALAYHEHSYASHHPHGICTFRSPPASSICLLPSHFLLQRLLPVLDMIRNDLGSLVRREIASDGLDEIALWICLSFVSPKLSRYISNATYPSNRSKCCDQPGSPDRAWYPWAC